MQSRPKLKLKDTGNAAVSVPQPAAAAGSNKIEDFTESFSQLRVGNPTTRKSIVDIELKGRTYVSLSGIPMVGSERSWLMAQWS